MIFTGFRNGLTMPIERGHWKAGFLRTGESGREKLSVKAGPGRFNAYLKPGEKVRMQKISLMFWDGGDGPRQDPPV